MSREAPNLLSCPRFDRGRTTARRAGAEVVTHGDGAVGHGAVGPGRHRVYPYDGCVRGMFMHAGCRPGAGWGLR